MMSLHSIHDVIALSLNFPNPPCPAPYPGILSWRDKDLDLLLYTLVLDLKPDQVEGHTPYIVAHLIYMCLRYPDHCHKEKETIRFIQGVIKGIQHVTTVSKDDLGGVWGEVGVGSVRKELVGIF